MKSSKIDVYHEDRQLISELNLLNHVPISQRNKQLILEFYQHECSQGLSKPRLIFYLRRLRKLAQLLDKDFDRVTKEDIQELLAKILSQEYSEWTKHGFKVTLKKFYRWLRGGESYPPEVSWIKTSINQSKKLLPEELLTEDEVLRMVEAMPHPRDKALIMTLYESGARAGEILNLKIKHISSNQYGLAITLYGKTGSRRIPLFSSAPHLIQWLNTHPMREDPEAPLWVGIGNVGRNKPLDWASLRKMLSRAASLAGIKKRIHPHIFRHSRATFLAKHLTEAQLNQFFGWVQGSDMPSTYVHLSGRDLEPALLKLAGIQVQKNEQSTKLKPKQCIRCSKLNPPDARFCYGCGAVLELKTALELEEITQMADQGVYEILEEIAKRNPQLLIEILKAKGWR